MHRISAPLEAIVSYLRELRLSRLENERHDGPRPFRHRMDGEEAAEERPALMTACRRHGACTAGFITAEHTLDVCGKGKQMPMIHTSSNANQFSRDAIRRTASLLFLVPMLALAACSTAHVSSDYDHSARFSSFHSFALIMRPHPGAKNPLVVQRTYDAIRAELTRKGFVYVDDPAQADFAVDFTIGASDRLDVRSYPGGAFGGPWMNAAWGNNIDVRQYKEGTLSVDMLDVHNRKAIWQGTAQKELSQSELEHTQTVIEEAVSAVLADFPPKGT